MYFYCTTKIKNYYKVGIAENLQRVKGRLTNYRSANPKTKIKFFSEIGGEGQHIEYSFKNKFGHFRVGRSECYKLNFEILYRHFLKFQHKFKKLHHFWSGGYYFLSDYYFDKDVPDHIDYDLSEKEIRRGRWGVCEGFIPIAKLEYDKINKGPDKDGHYKINAKVLDIKKINLKEYKQKYRNHLEEKWYDQQAGYANQEIDIFFDKNFKIKKSYKSSSITYAQYPVSELIFDTFDKNYKSLTKKYPKDPQGVYYWERPEQKSILGHKSVRMMRKVMKRYEENYNITDALRGVASVLPSNDPITYLETLHRIIYGNELKAPKELTKSLENIKEEILNLIGEYSRRKKIDKELTKQNKSTINTAKKNIIQFSKIKRKK